MNNDSDAAPQAAQRARVKNLLILAVPILGSALIDLLASFANSVVVGRGLGTDGLAAVGVALTIYQIVAQVAFAALAGFGILLAQRLGANDVKGALDTMRAGAAMAAIAVAVSVLALLVFAPYLTMPFGIPAYLSDTSASLLRALSAALALQIVSFYFTLLLYAHKVARPSFVASLVTASVNVSTTFLLLPALGIWAVVVGAAASRLFSAIVLGVAARQHFELRRHRPKSLRRNMGNQLRLSAPEILNNGLDYLGNFLFVLIVSAGGVAAVAANQVSYGLYMGVFAAGMSLAVAVQVYIGRSHGAGAYTEMSQYFRSGVLLGAFAFLGVGIVMALFAQPIAVLIVPSNTETQDLIASLLRLLVVASPLMCVASIALNRLRAVGRTTSAALINLVCTWVFQVGGALVLTTIFGPNVVLCYWALVGYLVARIVWSILAWRRVA